MNRHDCESHSPDESAGYQPKESFRIQFQHRLREYLARNESATDGFRAVWTRTAEHVVLEEHAQEELYWELLNWAQSYDLFTGVERTELLRAFRRQN